MQVYLNKICSKCGGEFPATIEFFNKNKASKDGLRPNCKMCTKIYNTQYTIDNKEELKIRYKEYREENRETCRENNRKYYSVHKDDVEFKQNNSERAKNNRSIGLKSERKYRDNNREKYRGFKRDWYRRNPEKSKEYEKRRRATKYGLNEHHNEEDIQSLYEEQLEKCYYCGEDLLTKYHVEHKTPLSREGTDTKENIYLSCPTCNWRKGSKTEEEFYDFLIEVYDLC